MRIFRHACLTAVAVAALAFAHSAGATDVEAPGTRIADAGMSGTGSPATGMPNTGAPNAGTADIGAPEAGATAAGAAAQKLTIGTEGAYPPFNGIGADGSLVGFDIDIAKALCAEMGANCTFVTQDWEGIIPALQSGRFDASVSSMAITEEHRKKVDFTHAYYRTTPAIAVRKGSTVTGVTPEELKGLSLGVRGSTVHSRCAKVKYKESAIRAYPAIAGYEHDLAGGALDAAMDSRIVLDAWLRTDAGQCCRILGPIKPDPAIHGEGAGIAVRKGDTDLVQRFNAALAAIRTNGTYKRINDKYFDFDIYGD
jgi:polar amino acid transport system substrate-binding protein